LIPQSTISRFSTTCPGWFAEIHPEDRNATPGCTPVFVSSGNPHELGRDTHPPNGTLDADPDDVVDDEVVDEVVVVLVVEGDVVDGEVDADRVDVLDVLDVDDVLDELRVGEVVAVSVGVVVITGGVGPCPLWDQTVKTTST
jgi:hypothetical protein